VRQRLKNDKVVPEIQPTKKRQIAGIEVQEIRDDLHQSAHVRRGGRWTNRPWENDRSLKASEQGFPKKGKSLYFWRETEDVS